MPGVADGSLEPHLESVIWTTPPDEPPPDEPEEPELEPVDAAADVVAVWDDPDLVAVAA